DGKPDLVTGNDSAVSVLLGDGDGSFQTPKTVRVGDGFTSVAVADFNGDGKPDLAVVNEAYSGQGRVSVLLGNGDGTFRTQKNFDVGNRPGAVAAADLNGDGIPDLLVANYGTIGNLDGNSVSVLLGDGDGTFQPQRGVTVGAYPKAIAVVDLNGDGKPDLVAVNTGANLSAGDTA